MFQGRYKRIFGVIIRISIGLTVNHVCGSSSILGRASLFGCFEYNISEKGRTSLDLFNTPIHITDRGLIFPGLRCYALTLSLLHRRHRSNDCMDKGGREGSEDREDDAACQPHSSCRARFEKRTRSQRSC